MAESEANTTGRGDVAFQANGRTYTLRPYLGAAKGISAEFGGLLNAYSRIRTYDMAGMSRIVAYGLDMADPKHTEEVEQIVYDAGIRTLAEPLCAYIERLGNRGQPIEQPKARDSKKKP